MVQQVHALITPFMLQIYSNMWLNMKSENISRFENKINISMEQKYKTERQAEAMTMLARNSALEESKSFKSSPDDGEEGSLLKEVA